MSLVLDRYAGIHAATEREAKLEVLRRQYRSPGGLLPFVRDVLKQKDVCEGTHGELCRTLEQSYWGENQIMDRMAIHRYMANLPRKSLKTSVITIGWTTWVMMQNDPPQLRERSFGWESKPSFNGKKGYDQRFVIAQENDDNVGLFIESIKTQLTGNDLLDEVFGPGLSWAKKSDGVWAGDRITIPWRRDTVGKEPNIFTKTLRSSINSIHNDIGLLDDIFSLQNQKNEWQLEAAIDFYKLYTAVADNPNLLWLIGTRWHDADLYGYVRREEPEKWTILCERAERTDEQVAAGKSRYFFPAKLPREVLEDMKSTMRPYVYSCQMLNDPIDPDTAMFKPSYFEGQYYGMPGGTALEAWLSTCSVYVLGDPAITEEKKACHAVVLAVAIDPNGHIWTLKLFRKKSVNPGEYLDVIFDFSLTYKDYLIGTAIENVGFQKIYKFDAEQRSRETGHWLSWIELKPGNRSKNLRIMGLEPIAKAKRIHLLHGHEVLEEEFLRFPYGTEKDGIDTLAYLPDVAFVPRAQAEEKPAESADYRLPANEFEAMFQSRRKRLGISTNPNAVGLNKGATRHWMNG